MISFTIHLPPESQKRARSGARIYKGAGKKGQDIAVAQTYTDEDQRIKQENLAAIIYLHRPPVPLEGALLLGVKAFLPIAPSKSKKFQAAAQAGLIRPIIRPDLDNLLKQIKDCAKGILWVDDKQVVGYLWETGKYYDDGEGPRWEVALISLAEM